MITIVVYINNLLHRHTLDPFLDRSIYCIYASGWFYRISVAILQDCCFSGLIKRKVDSRYNIKSLMFQKHKGFRLFYLQNAFYHIF